MNHPRVVSAWKVLADWPSPRAVLSWISLMCACVSARRPDARSTSASTTKGTMQQQRENQRRKAARALASHRLRRAASLRY